MAARRSGRREIWTATLLLLVPVLYLVAVANVADVRGMLLCTAVAWLYYLAAGIPMFFFTASETWMASLAATSSRSCW